MVFFELIHPIRWWFLAHAVLGALALVTLFIPLSTRKGSQLHIRAGWVYVVAMSFVGGSTFVITPWRIFFDAARTPETRLFAVFLFYVALFTLSALWFGIWVVRKKVRRQGVFGVAYLSPPVLTLMAGLALQVLGWQQGQPLLLLFPLFGHSASFQQIRYWVRPPTEKMHWWFAHMNGMVTASIATVTAFLVTALPRIWPGPWGRSPLIWMGPGLVLGTLASRWAASYREKFKNL